MIFFHTMYYICTHSLYTAAKKYQLGWLTSKQAATLLQLRSRWSVCTVRMKTFSPSHSSHLREPVGSVSIWLRKWIICGVISCSLLPYFTFQGFSFFSSCRFLTIFKTSPLSGFLYFLLQSTPPPLSASDIPLVAFPHLFRNIYSPK